jgi:hypothetical protein
LNGKHTIFGQCTPESVELVKQIARKATDPRTDRPFDPVKITSITFTGLPKPAPKSTTSTHKRPLPRKSAPKSK